MKIILASQSPRRAAILDLAKIEFEVLVSNYEEKIDKQLDISEQSKELAYGKALDVFNNTQGDRTIMENLKIEQKQLKCLKNWKMIAILYILV